MRSRDLLIILAAGALAVAGCSGSDYTVEERKIIGSLSLDALADEPRDPSNRFFGDPAAAAFGQVLFMDTGLSANGEVACATCHDPLMQFQDGKALSVGLSTTTRRAMPLAGAAYSPFQFWDGRKDSLWSQALVPWEDPREHGATRTLLVREVARRHRADYEALFGPMPDMIGLPETAGPLGTPEEQAAWQALDTSERDTIDAVFANLGKAVGAFVGTIRHEETRFDRHARAVAAGEAPDGDAVFTDLETEGLKLFIGKASCINCHNGPRFTDDHFHNTGVPAVADLPPDRGRAEAIAKLDADPFNCLGPHSDAPADGCGDLRFMLRGGEELERAYKTPSLRGAASRPPYMHAGQIDTLEDVVNHYSRAPQAPAGQTELQGVIFTDRGRAALIAFLKTLDPAP